MTGSEVVPSETWVFSSMILETILSGTCSTPIWTKDISVKDQILFSSASPHFHNRSFIIRNTNQETLCLEYKCHCFWKTIKSFQTWRLRSASSLGMFTALLSFGTPSPWLPPWLPPFDSRINSSRNLFLIHFLHLKPCLPVQLLLAELLGGMMN